MSRVTVLVLCTAALLAGTCTATPGIANAALGDPPSVRFSDTSGSCLDLADPDATGRRNANIQPCIRGRVEQRWVERPYVNGHFLLVNESTQQCLRIDNLGGSDRPFLDNCPALEPARNWASWYEEDRTDTSRVGLRVFHGLYYMLPDGAGNVVLVYEYSTGGSDSVIWQKQALADPPKTGDPSCGVRACPPPEIE